MKHFLLRMSALCCLALSTHIAAAQEDPYPAPSLTSLTSSDRPDAWKIKNALSAGPKLITDHATVMDWPSAQDKEDKMRVLREGSHGGLVCRTAPGSPDMIRSASTRP